MATAVRALSLVVFSICICSVICQNFSFEINYDDNTFMKDGKPFRYISGSIHYQRVPPEYWDDRLKKMAAAGLNAIQTYVPWNAHEKLQGQFDFSYNLDIVTFMRTAHKYNLSVILRPGPYICAEWEFGGLPAWLLKYPDMKVRTMDSRYIDAVDKWFTRLFTELKPMLHKNGGPIITVQIENEYGSYPACDYDYLRFLRDKTRNMLGEDVVLFTTDGDGDAYLKCGTLPDVYTTIDFGITYTPEKNFEIQRHKEPKGPLVNSEFYTGWLDHWGEKHSTVDMNAAAKSLDLMLALGANVNMYMFEGGTNFGFWNGANTPFKPVPTSYDYDAPLSEAGDITDKYMTLRGVIGKYNPLPSMKIPPSTPKKAYGRVTLSFMETILDYVANDQPVKSEYPLTMEALDHYYGFVLYRHQLTQGFDYAYLNMTGIRDRGQLMVGSKTDPIKYGFVQRGVNPVYKISANAGDYIHILVENMGRINYGGSMNDNHRGFIYNITLNGTMLTNWLHYPIKMSKGLTRETQIRRQRFLLPSSSMAIPGIYEAVFTVTGEPMDTYVDVSQWVKGQMFINGANLGRYWPHQGPQVRLYVPKFLLKTGQNQIVLLELEGMASTDPREWYVDFTDQPLVNGTVPPSVGGDSLVYGHRDGAYDTGYTNHLLKEVSITIN